MYNVRELIHIHKLKTLRSLAVRDIMFKVNCNLNFVSNSIPRNGVFAFSVEIPVEKD